MEDARSLRLRMVGLQVNISLLELEERGWQSILSSTSTTPEAREQAKVNLEATQQKLRTDTDELKRLERGYEPAGRSKPPSQQ
jgi:hypothetical protein